MEMTREIQELCYITSKRNEWQVVRNRVRAQYARAEAAYSYKSLVAKRKRGGFRLPEWKTTNPTARPSNVSLKMSKIPLFDLKIKTKELLVLREQTELGLHYHTKATTKRVRQLVKKLNASLNFQTSGFCTIRIYPTPSDQRVHYFNRSKIAEVARSYDFDKALEEKLA